MEWVEKLPIKKVHVASVARRRRIAKAKRIKRAADVVWGVGWHLSRFIDSSIHRSAASDQKWESQATLSIAYKF